MTMKKSSLYVLAGMLVSVSAPALAQTTPTSQMERLDRGVVALPGNGGGEFVSWRLLGTDD